MLEVAEELCPSCGQWTSLVEDTGFCSACSRTDPDLLLCSICNRTFKGGNFQFRNQCQSCGQEKWLARNADQIELYMIAGLPFEAARHKVEFDNKPLCLCCGRKINHGTRNRHFFCRRTAECRRAARSYKWHREHHNCTKEEAINRALRKQAA